MKKIILVLILGWAISVNARLATTVVDADEINWSEEAAALYEAEMMSDADSELRLKIQALKDKYDVSDNKLGASMHVDFKNFIKTYSGKINYGNYVSEFVVPVYVLFPGTGLIESVVAWIVVQTSLELREFDSDRHVITIKKVVPFLGDGQ